MQSTYFNTEGVETVSGVNMRYGSPFKLQTIYMHIRRHQTTALINANLVAESKGMPLSSRSVLPAPPEAVQIAQLLEIDPSTTEPHEILLNKLIALAQIKVDHNDIPLNANTVLNLIKLKSEIIRSNKDRKVDVFKTMFKGAAPKVVTPNASDESPLG